MMKEYKIERKVIGKHLNCVICGCREWFVFADGDSLDVKTIVCVGCGEPYSAGEPLKVIEAYAENEDVGEGVEEDLEDDEEGDYAA